jgi:predicted dehydrogenase
MQFAAKWNLNLWYTDYIEMIQKSDIDAIIINAPHHMHCPIALEAMRLGKHVLVDKPIATNLKEADEMIEEANRRHVRLGVILQSRFDPTFKKVRAAVKEGTFGNLILGEASVKWYRNQEYYNSSPWRRNWDTAGGGALINQSIHTIDLLLWIMGSPKSVSAQIGTFVHRMEVEDLAVAILRFKNDALGVVQGSTATYPGVPTRLEIYGSKGLAMIEGEMLKRWAQILGQSRTRTDN